MSPHLRTLSGGSRRHSRRTGRGEICCGYRQGVVDWHELEALRRQCLRNHCRYRPVGVALRISCDERSAWRCDRVIATTSWTWDVVVADLPPGVDGGSSAADLPFALQRQVVFYRTTVVPGSIVVDRESRFLYLIDHSNSARRYGIGIAQECQKGGSFFHITSKLEWPDWRPSGADAAKDAPAVLATTGRPGSPLGSRALLLDKPGRLSTEQIRRRRLGISLLPDAFGW